MALVAHSDRMVGVGFFIVRKNASTRRDGNAMAKSKCVCCKISNLTDSARRSGAISEVSIARQHISRLKQYDGVGELCEDHAPRRKPFVMMVEHWLGRVERGRR